MPPPHPRPVDHPEREPPVSSANKNASTPAPMPMGITMAQEPDDAAGQTAGGNRSEQPAENRAQHAAHDEYHHQEQRQQISQAAVPFPFPVRRRQRFAVDHRNHLIDACFHAAVVVALL